MEKDTTTVEKEPAVAPKVEESNTTTQEDAEARIAELEAAKNKAIEEAANYKVAFLKEKNKSKRENLESEDESEEDRVRRIMREEIANSTISKIDAEKEELLKKLAKENKELKLARKNTTDTPSSIGTHSESIAVTSTAITPEQTAAFKARGWTDKDIARYKENLKKFGH